MTIQEREAKDRQGNWFFLAHQAFHKNVENRIDGAVLALFDVTAARQHQAELQLARELAEAIVQTVHEPLAVLDSNLRVRGVNRAFSRMFAIPLEQVQGKLFSEISDHAWDVPQLRACTCCTKSCPATARPTAWRWNANCRAWV